MKIGRLIGLALILAGVVFLLYPNLYPQHAKICLRVDTNSLTVIQSEIETGLPLAMLDTCIGNLTVGDRSLEIIGKAENDHILDYSVSGVGTGYMLIRTDNFKRALSAGEVLTLTMYLMDRGNNKIADRRSEVQAPTPYQSYIAGVLFLITGAFLVLRPSSLNPKTASVKHRGRKKR